MNYTRWDTEIYLDFSEYLQLFEGFPSRSASGNYNASLIYNNKKPSLLQLSIFYENKFYIEDRLEYLQEHEVDVLSLIKPKRINNRWEHPELFDFTASRLIEMKDNAGGWEHGKKVVELIIDNVDIFVNGSYAHHGEFQLTENSICLIWKALTYTYKFSWSDWDGKLIDSDDNRNTQFGNFTFTLKLEHSYGNSDKFNLNITTTPYLYIESLNEDITDTNIINHGNLLCLLMSFYSCRRIDYFNGHVRIIKNVEFRTHKFFKYSDWTVDDTENFPLQSTYPLFYDFIDDISYSQAIFCSTLLEDIIPPIIQSKYVDESSRYMLLYNVIEKIRNFCLSNKIPWKDQFSIKEEYSFIKTGETLRKALKTKIQAIAELIIDDEKEEYLRRASDKITFMKKTGLKDQFDSLISYLGIDVNVYGIDFNNIVKVRNSLYHGGMVNLNTVKEYNPILRQIVNDLVLSLLK